MSAFEADRFNHSRTSPESSCPSPEASCHQRRQLAATLKERLQHVRAAAGEHSAANRNLMVQLRMVQDLHHRMHRPGLRVIRAIYQAPDAGMHQRAGAHRARFNCNKQVAVFQTMVTDGCTGLAQGDYLGVSRGISSGNVAIPSAAYDSALADHNRTYRNLSLFQSSLGTAQSLFHPQLVGRNFD